MPGGPPARFLSPPGRWVRLPSLRGGLTGPGRPSRSPEAGPVGPAGGAPAGWRSVRTGIRAPPPPLRSAPRPRLLMPEGPGSRRLRRGGSPTQTGGRTRTPWTGRGRWGSGCLRPTPQRERRRHRGPRTQETRGRAGSHFTWETSGSSVCSTERVLISSPESKPKLDGPEPGIAPAPPTPAGPGEAAMAMPRSHSLDAAPLRARRLPASPPAAAAMHPRGRRPRPRPAPPPARPRPIPAASPPPSPAPDTAPPPPHQHAFVWGSPRSPAPSQGPAPSVS